ncbi:carbohydrate ABC transporter substrate-binding protein [Paenibacillus mesophilus]|uniref:ABC transporter substrate-binding protein n=1 Tax=Paenibacillus mesophilus TaxID=2582849 RepID=UPI00110DB2CA|nr:ABC transporter substrate-binding protein [Paenibacillus mesophilus]TMV44706.1 carbohydrate ABC transporter substrate-binding protein [Paenibacillus mesophilus]
MSMKRIFPALLAAIPLMTSACGNSANDSPPPAATKSPESAAAVKAEPAEPVELVVFSTTGDSPDGFNQIHGDTIRQKFPNYTIKYIQNKPGQTLPELLAQKQRIDLIYQNISYFYEMGASGNLFYDMTDMVAKHKVDMAKFEPTLIDGIRSSGGGKLYGLPVTNVGFVLYYNKDIFDKFGVAYPRDGMYWDEMLDLAKKLTRKEGDKQYLGYASDLFLLMNNPLSVPLIDPKTEKPTFTQEPWKKLFDTIVIQPSESQAYKDRTAALKALPYRFEFTNSQELAMFSFISKFPQAVPDTLQKVNWDMVALPTFRDQPGVGTQTTPEMFGITSMAQHKEEAMNVIHYLTTPEAQTMYSRKGLMPVIKDEAVKKAFGEGSQFKNIHWSSVYYNKPAPLTIRTNYQLTVEGILRKQVVDIVLGKTDLNTATRNASEEAEKAIAALKSGTK